MLRAEGRSGWFALSLLVPYVGMVAVMMVLQSEARAESRRSSPMVSLAHR
jgi:hypothetical protein